MPWKSNEAGEVERNDAGNRIWINPQTGKESEFDPDRMHARITELGREAQTYRENAETLTGTLDGLKAAGVDIEAPDKAAEAMKRLRTLERDAKRNPKGGGEEAAEELQTLREENHTLAEQLEALNLRATTAEESLTTASERVRSLAVGGAFKRSKYFSTWRDPETLEMMDPMTTLPPDVAEAYFGQHFEPNGKDGSVHGFYEPGGDKAQAILGSDGSGPADFDTAVERLLERKFSHLKPQITPRSAPGSLGSTGGDVTAGSSKISRSRYDGMPPGEQHKFVMDGGVVVD